MICILIFNKKTQKMSSSKQKFTKSPFFQLYRLPKRCSSINKQKLFMFVEGYMPLRKLFWLYNRMNILFYVKGLLIESSNDQQIHKEDPLG